jgi:hypothetical protein
MTLDRQSLVELILLDLKRDPQAIQWGALRSEAEERVDYFLTPKRKDPHA